jgi:MoaA/NifB/PqqE/SkfB family radical SAM enzyme
MSGKISRLGVVLGFRCNFACAHCSVSDKKEKKLSPAEIAGITSEVSRRGIKTLLFIGGEPSLYIPLTNRILAGLPGLSKIKIKITTNGHFAGSKAAALATMARYSKLDAVQLSYDKFHARFLPADKIRHLYSACKESKREFGVLLAIQSPLDLSLLAVLRGIGDFPVAVQKVLPVGSARENKVSFSFPVFDRSVLAKRCENNGKAAYICGRGFSVCCANLSFGPEYKKFAHPTLEEHFSSPFYSLISSCTLGEIMRKFNITESGLRPEHSSQCSLCEHLFRSMPDFGLRGAGYKGNRD